MTVMTDAEQWEQMDKLSPIRLTVGDEKDLIVVTPRGRETFGVKCPVCGERVMEMRRWRAVDGKWIYYTLCEGVLHCLGERGRARRRKR